MSLNKKSLISFLLVFVFIFSVVPFNLAFADEPESEPVTSVATDSEDGTDAAPADTAADADTDTDVADDATADADTADDTAADTDADTADDAAATDVDTADDDTADAADDAAATDADTSDDGDAETTADDTTAADATADDSANADDNAAGDDTDDATANADDNAAGDDTDDATANADDNAAGDDTDDDTTNTDDNTAGDDTTENTPVVDKVLASSQALLVDGEPIENATIININGANYFKLRDIAYIVNGTASQFEVAYENGMVDLTTGSAYTVTSDQQELKGQPVDPGADYPFTSYGDPNSITVNGQMLDSIDGKKIDGNNYYKLRDLGKALGFSVGYSNRTMYISTSLYGYLKNCTVVDKALGEVVEKGQPPVFSPDKYSYQLTTEGDTIRLNTRIDFDDGLHFDAYIEFTEASVAGTDGQHVYTAHGSLSNAERSFIRDYSTDFAVQDTDYATIAMPVYQADFMQKTGLSENSWQSYLNLLNAAVSNSLTQFDRYVMHAEGAEFNPAELYTMSALGFTSAG